MVSSGETFSAVSSEFPCWQSDWTVVLSEFTVLSIDCVPESANLYCSYTWYGGCCVYFNKSLLHPASGECDK